MVDSQSRRGEGSSRVRERAGREDFRVTRQANSPGDPAASEARVQALLEVAVDGIIAIDERGIIETINPAAERLFGYAADELLGQNVSVLMPQPFRAEHDDYIARYLASGEKRIIGIGREVVALKRDGTTFPVDLSVAEARVGTKRIFVGMIHDITERKRVEAQLRKNAAMLERAVADLRERNDEVHSMTRQLWQAAKLASVGELAASIVHELNNPLATVALRIEYALARTPLDDPRRRALEVVAQETKRMGDLVANLLQFCHSRQEAISTVDVGAELVRSIELIEHHFRKNRIKVELRLAEDTPVVLADRQQLRQVYLNLLTNAGDSMPKGGTLVLTTSAAALPDGRRAARIEFSDSGVGIAHELLDKVTEPFFTTKEEGKGTGLGLAICRRIVTEHEGTLEIASTLAVGTTVRVVLPAAGDQGGGRARMDEE